MADEQTLPGPFTAPVPEPARRRLWLRALVVTAVVLAVLATASVVVFFQVFDVYRIPSAAMEPTLGAGDRVVVRGISGDDVHRGDIVVVTVERPDGPGSMEVIKRSSPSAVSRSSPSTAASW